VTSGNKWLSYAHQFIHGDSCMLTYSPSSVAADAVRPFMSAFEIYAIR
jgi:hypothetical protein